MERYIWLLPTIFMFHDMEEIIGMRKWLSGHYDDVVARIPMARKLLEPLRDISTGKVCRRRLRGADSLYHNLFAGRCHRHSVLRRGVARRIHRVCGASGGASGSGGSCQRVRAGSHHEPHQPSAKRVHHLQVVAGHGNGHIGNNRSSRRNRLSCSKLVNHSSFYETTKK